MKAKLEQMQGKPGGKFSMFYKNDPVFYQNVMRFERGPYVINVVAT